MRNIPFLLVTFLFLVLACNSERNREAPRKNQESTTPKGQASIPVAIDSTQMVLASLNFIRSIPGGADMARVRSLAEASGFQLNKRMYKLMQAAGRSDVLTFVADSAAEFNCEFSSGAFKMAHLILRVGDADALSIYHRIKDSLSSRFGRPTHDVAKVQQPFRQAEAIEALRAEKADFESSWTLTRDAASVSLNLFPILDDTHFLSVYLQYERPRR
jgi:hypothetical protein